MVEILTEDIRDAWYDLSQGVLDIVVKLFVLAQLRAIAIKTERITEAILKKVYDDELKPVHPMLEALRSGDPDKISNYSDLVVPDIDMKILKLRESIEKKVLSDESDIETFNGDEQAIRLYNLLLAMNCESKLLKPLVTQAIEKYPKYTIQEFISIILQWYKDINQPVRKEKNPSIKKIKQKEWHTQESDDIRFKYSQRGSDDFYIRLKQDSLIFDVDSWLKKAS